MLGYHRIANKIRKERRLRSHRKTPHQRQVTFVEDGTHWYNGMLAGPSTFAEDCSSSKTVQAVSEVLRRLTPDKFIEFNLKYYEEGIRRFGARWRYGDINTVLHGIAQSIQVSHYLEIGVRRGRSMAMIACQHTHANIVGFDMWLPNYAGNENPGPDFVREELARVDFKGKLELISGNSHRTVPEYFAKNPKAFYDVITVDGDHTSRGARLDLRTVTPRLKIGGILIFDDICNPEHGYLRRVWDRNIARKKCFQTYCFDELGYGVALAIRRF
jgi:predicted O-methyltransferase YrrM